MINYSDDKMELVAYQEAKTGNSESGDTYYVYKHEDFMLCAIADGLGNGPIAKESADVIPKILEEYPEDTLDDLLLRSNELMMHKRGAAVALVKVDYRQQTISYSCVGNIRFYMYQKGTGKMIYPLPVMGYLSGRKQNINTQTYSYSKGDLFLLHSDGITMKSPKLTMKEAGCAKRLYTAIMKEIEHGDDATLIIGSLL